MKRNRSSGLEDFKKRKYKEYLDSDSTYLYWQARDTASALDDYTKGKISKQKLDKFIDYYMYAEKRFKDKESRLRQVEHDKYQYKKSLPKKDNQGNFIVHGNLDYSIRLRTPKLKRKTAWKRFYKQYPDLKGEDYILSGGCSNSPRWGKKKLKKMPKRK